MGLVFLLLFSGGLQNLLCLCFFFDGMGGAGLYGARAMPRVLVVENLLRYTADADEGRRSRTDWELGGFRVMFEMVE